MEALPSLASQRSATSATSATAREMRHISVADTACVAVSPLDGEAHAVTHVVDGAAEAQQNTSSIINDVAAVAGVADFPEDGGQRCDHCHGIGELIPDFHYGDANPRLHRHCIKAWVAKYDAVGDIPPFLDRRSELQREAK
jgi:hypothetical protein